MTTKECENCGMDIPEDALTCFHCGGSTGTVDGFVKVTCPVHGVICDESYRFNSKTNRAEIVEQREPSRSVIVNLRKFGFPDDLRLCLFCAQDMMVESFQPLKVETEHGETEGIFVEDVGGAEWTPIKQERAEDLKRVLQMINQGQGDLRAKEIKDLIARPVHNPSEWKKLHTPVEAEIEGWGAECDNLDCVHVVTSRTPRLELRAIREPSEEERVKLITERPHATPGVHSEVFSFCSVECMTKWGMMVLHEKEEETED